jgi:hypothetical protein
MVKNSQMKRFLGPNETKVIARLTYEKLSNPYTTSTTISGSLEVLNGLLEVV